MLGTFLTSLPPLLEALDNSFKTEEPSSIKMKAHQLVSSAGLLGMNTTVEKLRTIESLALDQDLGTNMRLLIDQVLEEFNEAIIQIQAA